MGLLVDSMHLVVIIAGVAIGAWALIALRRSLPRARFAIFGLASAGALFGCAALAGEVGLMPPTSWFAVVMGGLAAIVVIAVRSTRRPKRLA